MGKRPPNYTNFLGNFFLILTAPRKNFAAEYFD